MNQNVSEPFVLKAPVTAVVRELCSGNQGCFVNFVRLSR